MSPESNSSQLPLSFAPQIGKPPTEILPGIFAFPPNRDTLGGTGYLIVTSTGNIAIDSPAWNDTNQQFIADRGGLTQLAITHRGNIGKATAIAAHFDCEVIVQEQEAYLLPELKVTTFQSKFNINDTMSLLWTPGHSPGSACFYYCNAGGVLFTGRHLLPNQFGEPVPLRTSKTFHWRRQLQSVDLIWQQFPSQYPLAQICPGANIGLLKGKKTIKL
jgi:glyoxylase-like metal-dependent hydrolase (beta-lactamase superfamily II)